jgi:hypothetical protein
VIQPLVFGFRALPDRLRDAGVQVELHLLEVAGAAVLEATLVEKLELKTAGKKNTFCF